MPTYEYECKKCGQFDKFQRITEPKLKKCPTCKGPVKRLLGAGSGIIFKGSGFYQTDYRSDSYKRGSKSDTSGSTSSSSASTPSSSAGAPGSSAGTPSSSASPPSSGTTTASNSGGNSAKSK